ncbi:MAG TPA: hypothetical protein VH722_07630, partial [Alphaproteobacteria bacterium]|nr:hypothetical protein [Alphaproteobacteria bacterium]
MSIAGRMTAFLVGASLLAALAPMAVAAAPPPLAVYGSLPRTEAVALSGDGNMLAMVETDGDQRLLVIETADGHPAAKVGIGDLKLAGIEWAGSDYVIAYMHSTSRLSVYARHEQEFTQGIIVNAKDGSIKPLLRQSGDYLTAIFGHHGLMKIDGHWVGYYGVVPLERSMDGVSASGFF